MPIGNITFGYSLSSDNAPSLAVPSGGVSGEDTYVLTWLIGDTFTPTWPAGFTEVVATPPSTALSAIVRTATRRCNGSEGANFTGSTSGYGAWQASCVLVKGVDAALDDTDGQWGAYEYGNVSTLDSTTNGITTSGPGKLVLFTGVTSSGGTAGVATFNEPSGSTEHALSDTGEGLTHGIASKTEASAGSYTYAATTSFTTDGSRAGFSTSLVFTPTVSVSVDQEGFRFGADDGSESTHTWLAAQDTNITAAAGQTKTLAVILNTTGSLGAKTFKLQYRKIGDPTWLDVPLQ